MRFSFVGRTRRSRRIRHFTALLGDTSLRVFQGFIDSLTTTGGVDHRSTHGIPESGHLRDVRHDFTFLGVFHGGGNTWIFRQLFLVRLQRYGTQRFVFINRFQTFVSQQIVFEELFRQLLFGLAALIPALSTPTNGLDG